MAAESLLGGSDGTAPNLSQNTKDLLNSVLTDTVGGSAVVTELAPGVIQVVGIGANGEAQGAVVSTDGSAIVAEITDGTMNISIQLPTGVSMAFEGPPGAVTMEQAQTYVNQQLDAAFQGASDPQATAQLASLQLAFTNLINSLAAQGNTLSSALRVINFSSTDSSTGLNEPQLLSTPINNGDTLVFDASGGNNTEIFALILGQIKTGNTLELKSVANAMLIGDGIVKVGDDKAANLQGDTGNQHITGGGGNDTLVGGGGNDTLIGGGGDANTFGFNGLGHYTVVSDNNDVFAFQFNGINSLEDLLPFVTGVTEANGNVSYEFVDGAATITLVGMSASDVTADMIKFSLI